MSRFKKLLIAMMFILIVAFALNESGFISDFNNMINERDGWKKHSTSTGISYSRSKIILEYVYHYSILNDPESSEFRIMSGAIKKAALDRMIHMKDGVMKVENKNDFQRKVKKIAGKSNTVLINSQSYISYIKTSAFGIGVGM